MATGDTGGGERLNISNEDLAYIAGILDGEGYLGVYKTKTVHTLAIVVQMTDPIVPTYLRDTLGGFLGGPYHKGQMTLKGVWMWSCQKRDILELLNLLIPFLKLKKEKALKMIEFSNYKKTLKRNHRKQEDKDMLLKLIAEMKS